MAKKIYTSSLGDFKMMGVAKGTKTLVKGVFAHTSFTVPINHALGKCEWQHQNKTTVVILCQAKPDVKAMARHCHSRLVPSAQPKKEMSSGYV